MARGKDNLETLSVTVDPTGAVAGARAVNQAMRSMRRQIEAELEAIRRSFERTGRGGQGTVGSYSDIEYTDGSRTRLRARQSYNYAAERREEQQREKAQEHLLGVRDHGRQALAAGYGKFNPGLRAAVEAASAALYPSSSLKSIQEATGGLESFWSPRGQRRALNRGIAINQQEAKLEKLHRQLDQVEKDQPALAGTHRFGYVRGRLNEAQRLLHGGGANALEESLHELSGVIDKHTEIISKSGELTKKENEGKKKELSSYLNKFSTTSAIAALGASAGRVANNYVQGGVTTLGQAPFEMMEGGGRGLSYMGRSKIIGAEGGMFSKAALGGWGMFLGGIAMELIGGAVSALAKRGEANADAATKRAMDSNASLATVLHGYPLMSGLEVPAPPTPPPAPVSKVRRGGGIIGGFQKNMERRRQKVIDETPHNAFKALSTENEKKLEVNLAAMRRWRKAVGEELGGPGYGMLTSDINAAMREMGGAGVDIPGLIGNSPADMASTIGFGRRAVISTSTIAKYLGTIGRGYGVSGSANAVDPLRALTGAAHHTGLRGVGADAFLQEMVAMQQRGESGGISTNWSDQARFVSSLAAGGISGAKLGTLSGSLMDTQLSARQKFTAGGKSLMEGLAIVQAAQRSDGSPSGMMRAIEGLTPEDRMQAISGMDPELQAIMFGDAGIGSKDIDAIRKRKDGAFSPIELDRAAYALMEDEASAEADHIGKERTGKELASIRGFTRVVDDAADALSRFTRKVSGVVVED